MHITDDRVESMPDDQLDVLFSSERFHIYRYAPHSRTYPWSDLPDDSTFSVTRTADETSLVLKAEARPPPGHSDESGPWSMFRLRGPLDHSLTGILNRLSTPLRESEVPIFALSTFDTDYVLVPSGQRDEAIDALRKARWNVICT